MKLFISDNSLDPCNPSFREEYVVAEKINNLRVREAPFGSGNYLIEGELDNGNRYWITLGVMDQPHADQLRRELFEWIAHAAASDEPTPVLLECHAGVWRRH